MTALLEGKVAMVTGGSRGMGAAIAKRLAQEGADVAVTYLSAQDSARSVVAEIERSGRKGLALAADSADADAVVSAVEQAAAELGGIDVLVNNAGIFAYGPLEEVTLEELDRTMAIHARAAFLAAQAAVPHMADGGRIINIGSSLALRVPEPAAPLAGCGSSVDSVFSAIQPRVTSSRRQG